MDAPLRETGDVSRTTNPIDSIERSARRAHHTYTYTATQPLDTRRGRPARRPDATGSGTARRERDARAVCAAERDVRRATARHTARYPDGQVRAASRRAERARKTCLPACEEEMQRRCAPHSIRYDSRVSRTPARLRHTRWEPSCSRRHSRSSSRAAAQKALWSLVN